MYSKIVIFSISSEYVRNLNNICKYNCDKKMDLIREGLGKTKNQ